MWHLGTWLSRHGGHGLTAGLDDLNGLYQLPWTSHFMLALCGTTVQKLRFLTPTNTAPRSLVGKRTGCVLVFFLLLRKAEQTQLQRCLQPRLNLNSRKWSLKFVSHKQSLFGCWVEEAGVSWWWCGRSKWFDIYRKRWKFFQKKNQKFKSSRMNKCLY